MPTDLPAGWVAEQVLAARPGRVVARARRDGADRPVVVKACTPDAGWRSRAALRREARLLDRLRGPDVVDLQEVVDRRSRTALVLAFVPPGRVVDPQDALLRLRATVERLHERHHLAHAALTTEHVLVDADGHPVLCGFGRVRAAPTAPAPDLTRLVEALAER